MNAARSSNYPDPFLEILQRNFQLDFWKIFNDPELVELFETLEYPRLQPSEIKIVSERISQGMSYYDSVKGFNYQFPFRPALLQQLMKCLGHDEETSHKTDENQEENPKKIEFCTNFILHSYIAYVLLLEKTSSTSYLPILLQSLNSILQYTELALQAFIRSLSLYVFKRDFYQIKLYIQPIQEFFEIADLKGSEYACDIFSDLLHGLTNGSTEDFNEDALELYQIIEKCADERGDIFLQKSAIKAVDAVKHLILKFDKHALSLASHCGPLLGKEYISSLCKVIVPEILKQISNEEPTITIQPSDSQESIKLDKPEQILDPILEFKDNKTFESGFNINDENLLPEKGDIFDLCTKPDYLASSVQTILEFVRLHDETATTYLDTFMDLISISVKNVHFYDMMAYFLLSGVELVKYVKLPLMVRFLYSDILFDPRLTCSSDNEESYTLNTLRSCAFELIIKEGASALNAVLIESMAHPQLFTEMVYRCMIYKRSIKELIIDSSKLLHTITTSMLYYQNYSFNSDIDESIIEKVRFSIFLFFSSLFSDREIETLCFKDEYFVLAFLSFSFEEPLRSFVMSQLRLFLTKDNPQATEIIGQTVTKIFEISRQLFPKTNAILLVNDILTTVIDSVSHQYVLAEIFKPVTTACVSSLPLLTNSQESQDFILNTLHFFSVIAHDFVLSKEQVKSLEKTISTVFENNPPQLVFLRLIQIMAADTISTAPRYVIHQPLILIVFYNVFIRTERKNEIIRFILDLCNYTSSNSTACHESGLDMMLIDTLLINWRTPINLADESIKDLDIDLVLQLYAKISETISSADVISKFLSLLSPNSQQQLPKYFEKALNCLSSIISTTLKSPESSILLPLAQTYMNKTAIDVSNGFTFVFWVELDVVNNQYKPIIFSFSDTVDITFQVTLAGDVIVIYQRTPKSESTARVDVELPKNHMVFVAFTYVINEGMATLHTSINCQDTQPLQFPILDFQGKLALFSYGGLTHDSIISDSPLLTGPIALFPPLDSASLSLIYGRGPRQLDRVPIHSYFSFIPSTSNDVNQQSQTFLNVLIKKCKLTSLLPLFGTLDMEIDTGNEDDESYTLPDIAEKSIELISNALLMSNDIEIEFANIHGFEILSELLLQIDFSHLTYSMYSRFFSLLQMLRTTELQHQLLQSILGNLDIWIVSDADNQHRILKNWSNVLFLTNSPPESFATFLSNTVIYYWDEILDRNYLKGTKDSLRPRPENLNVSECRQNMVDILLIMSQKSFTLDDFNLLMSYCKTCPDKGTVLSLANLLLLMTKTNPSPLLPIVKSCNDLLSLVHQLFKRKWPELTQILIETIAMLHVNKIIPPVSQIDQGQSSSQIQEPVPNSLTFIEHIEIIIRELSPVVLTYEVFAYLYQTLLPSIPELLPLCFWFAFNIGDSAIREIAEKTEPSEKFVVDIRWAQWPIIIASQTSSDVSSFIFDFIGRCSYRQWQNIYGMIVIICKAFETDYSRLLNSFLTHLSSSFLCGRIEPKKETLEAFFELVRQFLFFRDTEEQQKEFQAVFRFSPFSEFQFSTPNSPKPNKRTRSLLSPVLQNLFQAKRKFVEGNSFSTTLVGFSENNLPKAYNFGLRLNDRSRWIDFPLAQNILSLIHQTGYLPAFDIDLLICTFILDTDTPIALNHLRNFRLVKKAIYKYQNFIDLFSFKARRRNIACSFCEYHSPNYVVNSSKTLFETANWKQQKFVDIPYILLRSIKEFYAKHENVFLLTRNNVKSTYACYVNFLKPILCEKKMLSLKNKKLYQQLYSAITIKNSPWDDATISNVPVSRYSCGCFSNSVMKTKTKMYICNDQIDQPIDDEIQLNIRPSFVANCELITVNTDASNEDTHNSAEFLIFEDHFEIIFADNHKKVIKYREIEYILPRMRFFKHNSIEVFLKKTYLRKSYFISFYEETSDEIIDLLAEKLPRLKNMPYTIEEIQEKWVNRQITNFEYLMLINQISGRSFKDISQYPIFPWVVKDYSSEKVKILDTSLFRELTRPIGTLNDERIKKLRSIAEDKKTPNSFGYLYKRSYSNVPTVLSFLYNLHPFDNLYNSYKPENNVILPPMNNVGEVYDMITSEEEDFREAIPEFYFQAEIFNNVELPPWAHNSPLEFIYLNRKALESEIVSDSLNHWIDLIWGSKSRGREAMKAENTFKPKLFEESADRLTQEKYKFSGMMPTQLFTENHPKRMSPENSFKTSKKNECVTIDSTSNTIAFAHVHSIPDLNQILILSIDAAGILKTDVVLFNKTNLSIISNYLSTNKNVDGFTYVSDDTNFIKISNKYILAHDSRRCFIIDTENLKCNDFCKPSNRIQCIAADYPYFLILTNEYVFNVYSVLCADRKMTEPVFRIPFFRADATCAAISNEFHIFAIGAPNEIFILASTEFTLTKQISLSQDDDNTSPIVPKLINITPSWGFIIVYASQGNNNYLFTFSNNGELIKKIDIDFQVVAITSWKSQNCFDFIALASEKGKIFICEAFFLDIPEEPIQKYESTVKTIHYSEKMKMLTVVTRDGIFYFLPFSADDQRIDQCQQ